MEHFLTNAQIVAPIGALVALVIGFQDRIEKSLPYPSYGLAREWVWYQRTISRRTPMLGLASLILILEYVYTSRIEYIIVAVILSALMIYLLAISWLLWELLHLPPFVRRDVNRTFIP